MILRNQIVQCGHLHADLAAFRHPQSQRTAPLGQRSLLLGQILEQSLVSHRQPLLRAQCQRITASRPWQMLVAERFSHSEELAKQASRRMDATQGLAAILRDARKGRAPQDEVGDIFRASKAAIQYSEASMMKSRSRSVLDTPLEPVIGLAEGETRWRSMTIFARKRRSNPDSVIPGWSAGPDFRCAIAHRGISRFRVRCCASPRNDTV